MPFVATKVPISSNSNFEDFSGNNAHAESGAGGARRSSIKHAFTNILRSGSLGSSPPASRSLGTSPGSGGTFAHHLHSGEIRGLEHSGHTDASRHIWEDDDFQESAFLSEPSLDYEDGKTSAYGSSYPRQSALSSGIRGVGIRKYISNYLSDRGFLNPRLLSQTENISISLATSSEIVFLPTVSAQDDEYLSHLAMLDESRGHSRNVDPAETLNFETSVRSTESDVAAPSTSDVVGSESAITEVSNAQSIENDGKNVLFNIAVILSLKRPGKLSKIKAELYSRARVYWQYGVPPDKTLKEEYYTVESLDWDLGNDNFTLFVPQRADWKEGIIERQEPIHTKLFKKNENLADEKYRNRRKSRQQFFKFLDCEPEEHFEAGEYLFLLPVFFSNNIPETIYLPSGRVNYNFRCAVKMDPSKQGFDDRSDLSFSNSKATNGTNGSDESHQETGSHSKSSSGNNFFKKMKNHLHSSVTSSASYESRGMLDASYPINVIRMPPVISDSTADKPVYINRIWNNALSYEISLQKKFVPIGSEVPLKIKLAPIVKNIAVKRLRVSVLEKVTFVSKSLEYEFDQTEAISNDPYNPYYAEFTSRRKQERILPLIEIRSKDKGARALREEVVENCKSENILAYTTVTQGSRENGTFDVADTLTIDTKVKFPKYLVLDRKTSKNVPPYGIDEFSAINSANFESAGVGGAGTSTRRESAASGVIGFFAGRRPTVTSRSRQSSIVHPDVTSPSESKFFSNSNMHVQTRTKLNEPKRGLYLDSVNFENIHVKHKLEIMLRISSGGNGQNPEKHYEVLIDTPIFLVSDMCTNDNIELPTYDMATKGELLPPSFEEAISVPASPIGSPRVSPMGSPNLIASYDPEELSIQQLSLSRTSSQTGPDSFSHEMPPGSRGRRYTVIDSLINENPNSPAVPGRPIFKAEFGMESTNIDDAMISDEDPPQYHSLNRT
ncbi:LAMI_0A07272g1_1 [Lachancea mirantina]|uniref:LAMI_0A07272g1_1 n=1 Tax=Lachancea mirantina TaxID=1230905 RepID=A0A1G4IRC3_9SACH|nr:LAMI_0A07272g1_1 [Lachancea mirantina]